MHRLEFRAVFVGEEMKKGGNGYEVSFLGKD